MSPARRRSGLRRLARPGRLARSAWLLARERVPLPDAVRVARAGLVDAEYYAVQAGRSFRPGFAGRVAAAAHYLRAGRRAGFAPNPLFEPEWYAPADWRRRPDPLLSWLAGVRRPASYRATGPLFDPSAYAAARPESVGARGGPLGHALRSAGDEPLPVPAPAARAGAPTSAQARALLLDVARDEARRRALRRPRRTAAFSATATPPPPAPARDHEIGVRPAVSVVLPVRDRAGPVAAAIASVRAQTFPDWELLVVDDGSSDATPRVLAEQAAQDERIRVITRPPEGVGAARNAALAAARGRRVAFLDSDNTWTPEFLARTAAEMDRTGARAATAAVDSGVDGPRRFLAFEPDPAAGTHLDHLLVLNSVDLNALVVERELLEETGGFDEGLRRWVDHDLAIRVAARTPIRLVPFVGVRYDDDERAGSGAPRITRTESDAWQYAVLAKHLVDWDAARRGLADRVADRVSISMPTYEDWSLTLRAVRAVLDAADAAGDDVEVLVVDNGSRRSVPAILRAALAGDPRVRVLSQARNLHFATGSNLGAVAATGGTVVFLNNDTAVTPGWLAPLRAALDDPGIRGAQPVLRYPDGTVQSAGTVFVARGALPAAFLADHPPEDAARVAPIRLPAVTAAALAMRAADVVALRGFDPLYVNGFEDVDLCLRAVRDLGGTFSVEPASVVRHDESRTPGRGRRIAENRALFLARWAGAMPEPDPGRFDRLGLELVGVEWLGADPATAVPRPVLARRPPQTVTSGPGAGRSALRWAIKVAVPAGAAGDGAPDVVAATRLAAALERLGQQAAVDRLEAFGRRTAALDDVAVLLGGPPPEAAAVPIPTPVVLPLDLTGRHLADPARADERTCRIAAEELLRRAEEARAARDMPKRDNQRILGSLRGY